MFVLKSTYERLEFALKVERSHTEDLEKVNAKIGAENMRLLAKVKAYEKSHKPVKDKQGKWRSPKTGLFVKSPTKQNTEAQLRKEAQEAYSKKHQSKLDQIGRLRLGETQC